MNEFVKGVNVKTVKTKFGEIIKVGVNVEQFMENAANDKGFVNFDIKVSKKGELYATLTPDAEKK